MPKMNLDDVVASAWESLQPQTLEESKKSLKFLEKLLTNKKQNDIISITKAKGVDKNEII